MSTILRLRQVVAIIEAVLRETREPRVISEADVILLALLADEPGISGTVLARRAGRDRPNVVRSLQRLKRRRLVEPLESCVTLRTCGWALTKRGEQLWSAAARRLELYDRQLQAHAPRAEELAKALVQLMECLLNPHAGGTPWRRLIRPHPRPRVPPWDL